MAGPAQYLSASAATSEGFYDPRLRIYVPAGFARRHSQGALGKAISHANSGSESGGFATIVCIGDSETAGRPNALTSWPFWLRTYLHTLGYPIGGTGAWGIDLLGSGPIDARWTLAGGFALSGSPFWMKSTTKGATATFVSDFPGTTVDVWTFGNSGPFTVKVDSGTETTFTPSGTNGKVERFSVAGLTNAIHTVVVKTTTANSTYVFSVNVYVPETGVQVANFGASGTTTDFWVQPKSEAFTAASQVQNIYPAPDIVIMSLGVNDFNEEVPLAHYKSNLESLVTTYQGLGADVYLVLQAIEESFPQAAWEEWLGAQYEVAEAMGCGLYDTFALTGTYAEAKAAGLMHDEVHPNAAVHWQTAKSLAALIGAS
jgi:lysophospholipase L1-like esterase